MNKQLLQMAMAVGCAAGISLCAGCAGTVTYPREVKGNAVTPVVQTSQMLVISQHQDLLRLAVNAGGSTADEKGLAARIGTSISNAVSGEAIVGNSGMPDVRLTISPKLMLVDQTGDYYRMNCTVDVELKAVVNGQILGGNTVKVVSPKRVLGKDAAVAQFDDSVSKALAEWCRKELKRIVDQEVNVALLTIQLPQPPKNQVRDAAQDAVCIHAIGAKLSKMPNFISYELVGQDAAQGTCQYRIAYFKRSYPNGIANEVGASLKTIVTHK